MARKFLIAAIVGCVMLGVGSVLFDSNNDQGSRPSPSSAERHPTASHKRTLEHEQSTEPRGKNSKPNSLSRKDGAVSAELSHQPRLTDDLFVEVRHGVVTLRADHHSLKQTLAALAQESSIQINTDLIADRFLSLTLAGVPLEYALPSILQFEDSFLAFESRSQPQAVLKAVWVLPAGTRRTWPSQAAACGRDLPDLEQQLTAAHAGQRTAALDALIELQGPEAIPAVVQSLGDRDDNVRYRALRKAQTAGLTLPPEVLADRVQHDQSALVRMLALEAVGTHPAMTEPDKLAIAQSALGDDSPAMQTRVWELLSHLEVAPRMREQDQALAEEAEQASADEFLDENLSEQDEGP